MESESETTRLGTYDAGVFFVYFLAFSLLALALDCPCLAKPQSGFGQLLQPNREKLCQGYQRPPVTDIFKLFTKDFDGASIETWSACKIDEIDCLVSPVLKVKPSNEINHHRIIIDYTSSGSVQLSLGHSSKSSLATVLEKPYLHSRFQSVQSGQKTYIVSPYKGEHYAWILLRIKGDVKINKIQYACLEGKQAYYGHIAGNFTFHNAALPYRLMVPNHYIRHKTYPLVVTISGSGGIGNDNSRNMEMVGLARYLYTQYFNEPSLQCVSLVPQILPKEDVPAPYWPKGVKGRPTPAHPDAPLVNEQGWYTQASLELIRCLLKDKTLRIDPNRVYVTGFSYGGKGVWEFLKAAPNRFAGAIGVGGWQIGRLNQKPTTTLEAVLVQEVQAYKHVPVKLFAGENDVPMAKGSRFFHKIFTAQGGQSDYVEFPKTAHVPSAGKTWGNKENIDWLFQQNKKSNSVHSTL